MVFKEKVHCFPGYLGMNPEWECCDLTVESQYSLDCRCSLIAGVSQETGSQVRKSLSLLFVCNKSVLSFVTSPVLISCHHFYVVT